METQSASRITCPHCGEQNYQSDLVCWACNAALQAPAHPAAQSDAGALPAEDLPEEFLEPLPEELPAQAEAPLDGLSKFALAAVSLVFPGAGVLAGIILLTVRQSAQNRHFGIVCLGLALIPPIIWFLVSMSVLVPVLDQMWRQFMGPGNPLGVP